MNKITMMGTGVGILKPEAARFIPADKAVRPSKGRGRINTNPTRKDCLAWTDKNGKLVYRVEYEDEKYKNYVNESKDSTETITKEDFVKTLWE